MALGMKVGALKLNWFPGGDNVVTVVVTGMGELNIYPPIVGTGGVAVM
jgi:hypothetical protein